MGNRYRIMRERQQKKVDDVFAEIVFFAFNENQFQEGMKKIGAKSPSELYRLGSSGGFYKKKDAQRIRQLFSDLECETAEAFRTGGSEFAKEAFLEEMANHEYGYTHDLEPVLDDLGFTEDQVVNTPYLTDGLRMALSCFPDFMEVKDE